MSIKLPQSTFACEMQHKYAVGDKVRVTYYRFVNAAEGEIIALLPYRFVAPAYDVRIGSMIVAVSERSLERVENVQSNDSTIAVG